MKLMTLLRENLNRVFVFLTLVFLLFSILYFRLALQNAEKEFCDNLQVTADRIGDYMHYRLERTQAGTETLRSVLGGILNADSDFSGQLKEYSRLMQLLGEILDHDEISYCRIYIAKDKIYNGQITSAFSLNSMDKLELPENSPDILSAMWTDTHMQNYSLLLGSEQVISYLCPVRSQSNFEELGGVVAADVKISELQDILSTEGENEFLLVNREGEVLVSQDSARIGERLLDSAVIESGCMDVSGHFNQEGSIYIYSKLAETGWYVMTTMEPSGMYVLNAGMIMPFVLLVLSLLSLSLSISLSLHHMQLKYNVSKIRRAASQLKENRFPPKSLSENAGPLSSGFASDLDAETEQIIHILMDAIEEQYKSRLAVAEYQMISLQAQIKPHFLYNTLDAIKWMVLDQKTEDSVWMLNELFRFMRLSFSRGNGIVPLSEETEHIRAYLGLMQKRFTNEFKVIYELEPETEDCLLPKFTLQPLVENALLHGILYCKKKERHLTIRSWKGEGKYTIEIEDNRNGMTQEAAAHLLDARRKPEGGYGIYNVYERLMIFSQNQCGFDCISKEGTGTCISIELPTAYSFL